MTTSSTPGKPGAPDPDDLHAVIEARIATLEEERRRFVMEQHDALNQEEAVLAPYAERLRQLPAKKAAVAAREQHYLIVINELKCILEPPPALEDLLAKNAPQKRARRGRQAPAVNTEPPSPVTALSPQTPRRGRRR